VKTAYDNSRAYGKAGIKEIFLGCYEGARENDEVAAEALGRLGHETLRAEAVLLLPGI
jgi:hypothetical protein